MGRFTKIGVVATLMAGAVAVTACSGPTNVRKSLGLIGEGPDEFTVVKRKPLTMPENLEATSLPTPTPGAPNLVDPRPMEDAQLALKGETIVDAEAPSQAEVAFIAAAGAEEQDDAIREQIALDDDGEPELILNRLLGRGKEQADALDPAEEADRLAREAQLTKNPSLELLADDESN